jgi:hypothetical protein
MLQQTKYATGLDTGCCYGECVLCLMFMFMCCFYACVVCCGYCFCFWVYFGKFLSLCVKVLCCLTNCVGFSLFFSCMVFLDVSSIILFVRCYLFVFVIIYPAFSQTSLMYVCFSMLYIIFKSFYIQQII